MIRIGFLVMLGCCVHFCKAQFWLSGKVTGYSNGVIYLLQFENSKTFAYEIKDSTLTDSVGRFVLQQPAAPGMYRICQGKEGWYSSHPGNTIHLWLGLGENVVFSTIADNLTGAVQFSEGKINSRWYANETNLAPYLKKLGICMQLLDMYPTPAPSARGPLTSSTTGNFYFQIQKEYMRVQRQLEAEWRNLKKQEPGNPFLDDQRRLSIPLTGNLYKKAQRTAFWKQHLLDSVDFSNPTLQASHLLGQKLEQYMSMYGFPYDFANPQEADSALLPAVKNILKHCRSGYFSRSNSEKATTSLQFVAAWLYNFCTEKGLDKCLAYTADQLTADVFTSTCNISPGTLQTLQRMQASQRLKSGMAAPEIVLNGMEFQKLSDIKASKTLLVFWASWCSHCQEELPKLKKIYDSTGHKDWEVLAVSIDTSRQSWLEAISSQGYSWLNYYDGRGWESTPVRDYGVFSTPIMILLDEKKKILARPSGVEEVKTWVLQHKIN